MNFLSELEKLRVRPEKMDTEEYVSCLLPVLKGLKDEQGIGESLQVIVSECYYDLSIYLEDLKKINDDSDLNDEVIQARFNLLRKTVLKRIDDFTNKFFSSTDKRYRDRQKTSQEYNENEFQNLNIAAESIIKGNERSARQSEASHSKNENDESDIFSKASFIKIQLRNLLDDPEVQGKKREDIQDKLIYIEQQNDELKDARKKYDSSGLPYDKSEVRQIENLLRKNILKADDLLRSYSVNTIFKDTEGKRAKTRDGSVRKTKDSKLDLDSFFDLAENFISPEDSPEERVLVAQVLIQRLIGNRTGLNHGYQRA